MADNSVLPVNSGTETFANDDVGGIKYPRAKLVWGADGTANDADTASGKPIPMQMRHSDGTIVSDSTGIKISTAQLPSLQTTQQPFSPLGAQGIYLPSDHPAIPTIAAMNSAAIYNGATSMTPAWAVIAASASGANAIKAADATKKIRVLAWDLSPSAAVNAKWQSASTDLTGLYYMGGAGNGQRAGFNIAGWFETVANQALNLNLSSAVPVGGVVCYVLV